MPTVVFTKIKIYLTKQRFLIGIFTAALLFRLIISPLAFNGDLITQTEWGKWMYFNTPKGLYDWNVWVREWPNHPPLISLIYFWSYHLHRHIMHFLSSTGNFIAFHRLAPTKFIWFFNLIIWFGSSNFFETSLLQSIPLIIKFFMVIADIAIGLVIYLFCRQTKVNWKKYLIAYLCLPFSWYLSAIWGQSDPLAFLFLIGSFIVLNSDFYLFSPLLFGLSINLKPTGLVLLPLFVLIALKNRRSITKFIIGITLSLGVNLWITSFFTTKPLINFVVDQLPYRLFSTKPPFTTVSAFNFWYIFHAKDLVPQATKYLLVPANYWGYLAFALITIFSIIIVRPKKIVTIFAAVFVSGFGGWLFMTNMYERYLFTGIVSLLFLSIYKKNYFKYFLILSTIYLLNMYNGWWFPQWLVVGKEIFLWNHRLITRALSLINVLLYIKIIWSLRHDLKKDN